jgi:hypothetical protein
LLLDALLQLIDHLGEFEHLVHLIEGAIVLGNLG